MPALATLTLVWLGAQTPNASANAALERWAAAHTARLETPHRDAPSEDASSAALAERCERWLEQARDQMQAGDDETAAAVLAELDQSLREHPELLQASFLMAERYRVEARIQRRTSPDRAAFFDHLADVTEGPRATAFGETPNRAPSAIAKIRVTLVVHGVRRHEIYWDGTRSGDDLTTEPGEHHLLVFRGARPAWAGWVSTLSPGKVDIWAPDAAACSAEDFEGVTLAEATRIDVPAGVRCTSWLAASPGARPGTLNLAVCSADRCEPSATWGDSLAAPAPDERSAGKSVLPPWAIWTLAGVGVAATTSIVLWRTGVFDTARQSKVIYDGTNL